MGGLEKSPISSDVICMDGPLCLVLLQVPKFFELDQKFNHILWQSQTFCVRQKYDLYSVKLFFELAQKFLKMY